jgi:hypothetical protein
VRAINRGTFALLVASHGVVLKVNFKTTTYRSTSYERNAGQNYNQVWLTEPLKT